MLTLPLRLEMTPPLRETGRSFPYLGNVSYSTDGRYGKAKPQISTRYWKRDVHCGLALA
jgi:hypothetical protein